MTIKMFPYAQQGSYNSGWVWQNRAVEAELFSDNFNALATGTNLNTALFSAFMSNSSFMTNSSHQAVLSGAAQAGVLDVEASGTMAKYPDYDLSFTVVSGGTYPFYVLFANSSNGGYGADIMPGSKAIFYKFDDVAERLNSFGVQLPQIPGVGGNYTGYGVIQDYTNRLVLVGMGLTDDGSSIATVVRLLPTGEFDTSFNGTGYSQFAIGTEGIDEVTTIKEDGNHKLVIGGGTTEGGVHKAAIVRLNENGLLDTTFNTTGIWKQALGDGFSDIFNVLIDHNAKIVACGYAESSGTICNLLVRLNSNGTYDTTFNGTGYELDVIESDTAFLMSLIEDTNHKLVGCGQGAIGGTTCFMVARFNPTGGLDTTFNTTGYHLTVWDNNVSAAASLLQDETGNIVAAGYTIDLNSNLSFVAARYLDNGAFDTTFNVDGHKVVQANFNGNSSCWSIFEDASHKLVLSGANSVEAINKLLVVRLNSNGSLDTTFNATGSKSFNLANGDDSTAYASLLDSNGKIVVVGTSLLNTLYNFVIIRLNNDGSYDSQFNKSIVLDTAVSGIPANITSVKITRKGNSMQLYLNGSSTATLVANDSDYTIGEFGFATDVAGHALTIDNILVDIA